MRTSDGNGLADRTVGELVAEDYARAGVFERLGIDFCCGGERSLRLACEQAGVALETLDEQLAGIEGAGHRWPDASGWEPTVLARYIVDVHHAYVRASLPTLARLSEKAARVHGEVHSELRTIRELVGDLSQELDRHLSEEESQLFPRVTDALGAVARAGRAEPPSADHLLASLRDDHEHAGRLVRRIRRLSDDYRPPETACATYRTLYAKLRDFEEDLHRHVHLENNVLFPRVRSALGAASGAEALA